MKFFVIILMSLTLIAGESDDVTKLMTENDIKLQDRARKYLSENSNPEEDHLWIKKLKQRINQSIFDKPEFDENNFLNQIIVDWAAGKDFKKLSDKDKLFACRMYLIYRDKDFSPFNINELQLPEKMLNELKKQKMDEWFTQQEKSKQEEKK